jgi:hypothetical protein
MGHCKDERDLLRELNLLTEKKFVRASDRDSMSLHAEIREF